MPNSNRTPTTSMLDICVSSFNSVHSLLWLWDGRGRSMEKSPYACRRQGRPSIEQDQRFPLQPGQEVPFALIGNHEHTIRMSPDKEPSLIGALILIAFLRRSQNVDLLFWKNEALRATKRF